MTKDFAVTQSFFAEKWTLMSVYFALLLDNLLLTAVVPILPHYVHNDSDITPSFNSTFKNLQNENETMEASSTIYTLLKSSAEHFHLEHHVIAGDNSRLGFLLSLKAIVQLVANPLIAFLSKKFTLPLILLIGSLNIFLCSLMFAFGKCYVILAIARALQGITSACFTIAGLGLVASIYKDEVKRSIALAQVLGGGAVGVLLGYPFGSFFYQAFGKTTPFFIISVLACALVVLFSLIVFFAKESTDSSVTELSENTSCFPAEELGDQPEEYTKRARYCVLGVAVTAIFLTTSVMALLEPCLPLWLLEKMKPERWQLGAVFIPDSCGYLLATHFGGGVSYRLGRWLVSLFSILILGVSCFLVPLASSIIHLTIPHFFIGAGIGAVDASLVPLLATLVDDHHGTKKPTSGSYGTTFALGQTAVSLAYCLGPALGSFVVESVGFPIMMVTMGVLNILFSPLVLLLKPKKNPESQSESTPLTWFKKSSWGYARFESE